MAGPCSFALGAARVPSKRFRTRAELFTALEQARTLLEENSRPPALLELSRATGIAPHHLQRLFRAVYGQSPRRYAEAQRLERGCRLLTMGFSVGTTALELGFVETSAFSRAFVRRFGCSPTKFRKKGQALVSPLLGD